MFLKNLEIEGYGPFLKKVQIDFSELNFFCIQGENGTGKSTLVDAIFFALWSESGKAASYKDLIPESASRTRVYLEFEMNGEKIQIERIRGHKNADTLKVSRPEGTDTITGTREVTHYVQDHLGLKKSFISRAFLISQGKFDEILKSGKSENREAILEIVAGKVFKEIQEKISEKSKELENGLNLIKGSMNDFSEDQINLRNREIADLKIANQNEIDGLEKEKQSMESQKKGIQKQSILYENFLQLEKEISFQEKQVLESQKELVQIQKSLKIIDITPDYQRIHELEKKIEENRKNLKNLENQRDHQTLEYEQLRKKLEIKQLEIKKNKSLTPVLDETQRLCIQRGQKAEEYTEKKNSYKKRDLSIKEKQVQLDKISEKLKTGLDEIKKIESEKKKYVFKPERLEALKKSKDTYSEYLHIQKEKLKKEKDFNEFLERIKKIKSALEDEKKALKEKETEERILRERLNQTFSDKVREGLKDGESCPVCGGIYHIHKGTASRKDENILQSENQWESLKKDCEELKRSVFLKEGECRMFGLQESVYVKEIKGFQAQIEEKELALKKMLPDFPLDVTAVLEEEEKKKEKGMNLENTLSVLQAECNQFEIQKKESSRIILELTEENNEINGLLEKIAQEGKTYALKIQENLKSLGFVHPDAKNTEKLLQEFKEKQQSLERELKESEAQIHEKEKEKQKIQKDHEFTVQLIQESEKTMAVEKEHFNRKLVEHQIDLKELGHLISQNASKEDLAEKELKIKELISRFEGMKKKYAEDLKNSEEWKTAFGHLKKMDQELSSLFERIKLLGRQLGEMEKEESQIKTQLEKYRANKKEFDRLDSELAVYRELKADFETHKFPAAYARMVFERIIEEANTSFLSRVLDGRYSFQMGEKKDEFIVEDRFEQRVRPIDTLSGGEKFLISFALALAFSRTVGDKIGLFFIDEGFGTLDEKNRYLLQEIFDLLSREKKRKIGLITHIPEIAEAIPQKIRVQKNDQGSFVEVFF